MTARRLDRLAVLGAALLFSTGGVVIKATSWNAFAVAGGRSAVAALVLLLLMPRWRRFWDPKALAVGTGFGATMVLFVIANKFTGAANAIFLQSTAPLYVLALAPWLLLPGVFVIVSVLAFNFMGNGIRDAADPYSVQRN